MHVHYLLSYSSLKKNNVLSSQTAESLSSNAIMLTISHQMPLMAESENTMEYEVIPSRKSF